MKNKYNLKNHFFDLWKILNYSEKKNFILLFFLMIISIFIETLSLGSIYPLLLLFFDKEKFIMLIENLNFFEFESLNNLTIELSTISIFICILFLVKNFIVLINNIYSQTLEKRVIIRLKSTLLQIYLNKEYSQLIDKNTAILIRNIMSAVNKAIRGIRNILTLINEIGLFIFLLILIAIINLKLFLILSFIIIIPIIILGPISKKIIIKGGASAFHYEGVVLKNLMQALSMIKEIKIFGKIGYFLDYFSTSENRFQSHERKLFIIKTLPKQIFEILAVITFFLILNLYINISNNDIQDFLPSLGIIIISAIRIFPSLNKVILSIQKYQQVQKSIDEIKKDLNNKNIENFFKDSSKDLHINLREFNQIKLDNISFKYKENEKYIIQKYNLTINKFDKIGVTGHSGSGKSTLIEILIGLFEPNEGKILFDGLEMQEITNERYKLFGYVPQKIVLIDDTLISNITLEYDKDKIDYQKLDESLRFSGLTKFVNKNKGNLDIIIGENGSKMSGGEKQRVAIARAVYKNRQILVFDESFNGLDVDMKKEILNGLKDYLQHKTAIFISHNVDDLKLCNKIIKIN